MIVRKTALLRMVSQLALLAGFGAAAFGAAGAEDGPPLTAKAVFENDAAHPGDTVRAALVVTVPEGWHVNANKPLEEFLIPTELTMKPTPGFTLGEVAYPEPVLAKLSFSDTSLALYAGEFIIGVVISVDQAVAPGEYAIEGALRYQACNDTQCWPPANLDVRIPVRVVAADQAIAAVDSGVFAKIKWSAAPSAVTPSAPAPSAVSAPVHTEEDWRKAAEAFRIVGRASGYLDAKAFLAWLDAAEGGQGAENLNTFAGRSLWAVVVLTLVGGLALNLTPCVLPLIPINLAIIGAGAQSGSKARGFVLGGLYGAGIALSYGLLGAVVVLTTGSFGTINASPYFNFAIAAIFVVLGLAMFDVLLIDFTRFQEKVGAGARRRGGLVLAFVMGCIAALLAGACVAPVVIAVVLFSRDLYAAGSPAGLALPFVLGLGMALPWPVAGAGIALLPKPGRWMMHVKHAFGALIFVAAAYYGYLGYTLLADRQAGDRAAAGGSGLDAEGWATSLEEGLAEASATGKPVLIDFWATWCKNCLTMNETTFRQDNVNARLEGYVLVKYQAQEPDQPPAREVLDRFGVGGLGLPVYVILEPAGK